MDFLTQDKRFFVEKGDPGFDPNRNKKIVEDSIKKHAENKLRLEKEYADEFAERADAVATYLLHADQKSTTVEQYFGTELERLQSRKLVQTIQGAKRSLGWL